MKALGVLALGILAPPALALPVVLAGMPASSGEPTGAALEEVPPEALTAYLAAAPSCPELPWPVLAAVGAVESDHGRAGGGRIGPDGKASPPVFGPRLDGTAGTQRVGDTDGGRLDADPVLDRAVGPMQFLPETWARWGRDADGDGTADPQDLDDATASAAAYLCGEDGRLDDLEAALFSYNHSPAYVAEVLAEAERYGTLGPAAPAPAVAALLADPRVELVESARRDLSSGSVDPRIVAVLSALAGRFRLAVGVIRSGHSPCVGGGTRAERPACTLSDHYFGRGVDIFAINASPVSASNAAARQAAEFLVSLPEPLRPDELGVPWPALSALPGVFSDASHRDHLHVSYDP